MTGYGLGFLSPKLFVPDCVWLPVCVLAWLHAARAQNSSGGEDLLGRACAIADATIATKRWPDGVLREQCDADGSCNADGESFKGIFARYLRVLVDHLPANGTKRAGYRAWLAMNARHVWDTDRSADGLNTFGCSWEGPYKPGPANSASVRIRSALDVLSTQL